jgi:uncharacterized membrane protein YfcA
MRILLPIAGLSINVLLLVVVGGVIGLLSGLLGVGGGFLLTPILMMIGVPPTVAAASDTNSIVATSASGVAAHFRLDNVDVRMGILLLLGGLAGSALGVRCIKVLKALGNADVMITLTYIIVLGFVGGYILRDSFRKMRRGLMAPRPHAPGHARAILNRLPFQMDFPRSGVRHSLLVPFALCSLVGVLTAIMGVGGGFMLVPVMVYLLGMPAHVAVGTSLFQILFTCAGATVMQATTNHTVDLVLALILAVGSTIGAQIGARLSRLLRGEQLMIILGILAIVVMLKMAIGVTLSPGNPLSAASTQAWLKPVHDAVVAHLWQLRRLMTWG